MAEPGTHKKAKKALRVLFAAAEADPIIKVGGLGDVTGSLPRALRALGRESTMGTTLDVRLVIPFHPAIRARIDPPRLIKTLLVPHPYDPIPAQAYLTHVDDLPVYLIDGAPISAGNEVYSLDTRRDGEKYTFFSLAILELARALDWQPHILHANDWHTALSVHMLRAGQRDDFFAETHTILTVHNLPFMGSGTEEALASYGIPPAIDTRLPPWGAYQPLPMGMSAAEAITTVSPGYANEILTPEFGSGLQDFLQMRAGSITGILNGLDESLWDPSTDRALVARYNKETLDRREENKAALLKEMALPARLDLPLLIFIGRMDRQKGLSLALEALREIADLPWQCILLGAGDPGLQKDAQQLEVDFPNRVRTAIRFDAQLSRRMYAGGDMLLMPSRYEPCGLAQMIAMRYGCVPVARATGGLRDTIRDEADPANSTGFLFEEASSDAMTEALQRAISAYNDSRGWRARQLCGMQQDFTWQRSAQAYVHLYNKLLE